MFFCLSAKNIANECYDLRANYVKVNKRTKPNEMFNIIPVSNNSFKY